MQGLPTEDVRTNYFQSAATRKYTGKECVLQIMMRKRIPEKVHPITTKKMSGRKSAVDVNFIERDEYPHGKGLGNKSLSTVNGFCDIKFPQHVKIVFDEVTLDSWMRNSKEVVNVMGLSKCCASKVERDVSKSTSASKAERDISKSASASSSYYTPCNRDSELGKERKECDKMGDGGYDMGLSDKDECDMDECNMDEVDIDEPDIDRQPYHMAEPKTSRGPSIDVMSKFITDTGSDDGSLVEIKRLYMQHGKVIGSQVVTVIGKEDTDAKDNSRSDKQVLFGDLHFYPSGHNVFENEAIISSGTPAKPSSLGNQEQAPPHPKICKLQCANKQAPHSISKPKHISTSNACLPLNVKCTYIQLQHCRESLRAMQCI